MRRDILYRLMEALEYTPETGVFRWRIARANVKPNDIAGCLNGRGGYVVIRLDDVLYRAHRLAWIYMTGCSPPRYIDHINGVRTDNRWANLREATQAQNNANAKRHRNNVSGFKGVIWHTAARKWQARIVVNGRQIHLGVFTDPKIAHAAYCQAATRFYGDYARFA